MRLPSTPRRYSACCGRVNSAFPLVMRYLVTLSQGEEEVPNGERPTVISLAQRATMIRSRRKRLCRSIR